MFEIFDLLLTGPSARCVLAAAHLAAIFAAGPTAARAPAQSAAEHHLYVDPVRGDDKADGSERRPLRSISAALARLDEPLRASVTVHLAPGTYASTGGEGMPAHTLELMHRMRPEVVVHLAGPRPEAGAAAPAVLAWEGERRMIEAREGNWKLSRVQVGAFATSQRRGVTACAPACVVLEDVTFRLRSESDAGIWARDGGRVLLRGAIRLNEHLVEDAAAGKTGGENAATTKASTARGIAPRTAALDETFCGLLATDHGVIEFETRDGSSLVLGNGSLSARYWGSIRLGCATATVSCWTQSNNLTVNNSGRIDLRNTHTTLRAHLRNNTPIGLEHDGHVLAEDAHLRLVGPNDAAIALQKASTFTCNDIELVGEFGYALWASSGSMFVGRFLGDVPKLEASTGASIHVEKVGGRIVGPVTAKSGGLVSLPDRVVRSE